MTGLAQQEAASAPDNESLSETEVQAILSKMGNALRGK
jgi:hypothetical protein